MLDAPCFSAPVCRFSPRSRARSRRDGRIARHRQGLRTRSFAPNLRRCSCSPDATTRRHANFVSCSRAIRRISSIAWGAAEAAPGGEHPRDAEQDIVQLLAKRPNTPGLDSLLRAVREAYDPRAVDAAQWVASEPFYAPYRLALARALAREKLYRS